MKPGKTLGNLMLFTTALIWGSAFVAQSVGAKALGNFTYCAIRLGLAFLFGLPFALIALKKRATSIFKEKRLLLGGGVCGGVLFAAMNTQQAALSSVSVGKGGFISSLYIVIVPLLCIFYKKKPSGKIWAGVGLCCGGLWLLCMKEGLSSLTGGDLLMFASAVLFALHIMAVDRFAGEESFSLNCLQMGTAGVLSALCMLFFEKPDMALIMPNWFPLLYAGVFSGGLAFLLQAAGQKYASPAAASIIMSLESVFALLAGYVFLKEKASLRELAGCAVMLTGMIISQLPEKTTKNKAIGEKQII